MVRVESSRRRVFRPATLRRRSVRRALAEPGVPAIGRGGQAVVRGSPRKNRSIYSDSSLVAGENRDRAARLVAAAEELQALPGVQWYRDRPDRPGPPGCRNAIFLCFLFRTPPYTIFVRRWPVTLALHVVSQTAVARLSSDIRRNDGEPTGWWPDAGTRRRDARGPGKQQCTHGDVDRGAA